MKTEKANKLNKKNSPIIYAYTTPDNAERKGWIKIGYTTSDADSRILEQTKTVGIKTEKLWEYEAQFNDGESFTDIDFHNFLKNHGIKNEEGSEWFYFGDHPEKAKELIFAFISKA